MKIWEIEKDVIYNLINPYLKKNQHIIDIDCDEYYNCILIKIGMGFEFEHKEYTKLIMISKSGKIRGDAIFTTDKLREEIKNKLDKIIKKNDIILEECVDDIVF